MVDALMEADLEAVKRERLPETERDATARRLLEAPADDDSRYLESFEAGYRWGEEAQIFLTGPATVRDEIAATAERYDELRKTGPVEALASGVMASRTGAFITNADTNADASVGEAFRARRPELATTGEIPLDESLLESAFHAGAVFYAFETQLLLDLRRNARLARASRP
jgi:hypothetical protein